jgi:hypothetical protein
VSVQATEAGPAPRVSGWSQRQRVSFRQASGSGVREVAIQLAATAREAPIFFSFYGEFSSSDARFRFLQATVPAWLMTTPAILVYYTGKKMCSMEDVRAFLTGDRMVNPEPDLGCFPLQKKMCWAVVVTTIPTSTTSDKPSRARACSLHERTVCKQARKWIDSDREEGVLVFVR